MKVYVFVDGLKKHTDERVKCIIGVKRITVRGNAESTHSSRRIQAGAKRLGNQGHRNDWVKQNPSPRQAYFISPRSNCFFVIRNCCLHI